MAYETQVPAEVTETHPAEVRQVLNTGAPVLATAVEPATHDYRLVQATWFIVSVITTLVAIRFVLKLLGASAQSGFVTLIYGMTNALVAPFRAMFATPTGQGSTLDVAALVAIVVYALIGWGVVSVIKLATTPRGARSVS